MQDWYAVLHVANDAPDEVVRAAYRALSQRWHPDRNLEDPTAIGRMMEINQAYDVLSDTDARAEFDRQWIAAQQAIASERQRAAAERSSRATPKTSSSAIVSTQDKPERPAPIHRQVRFWFVVLATLALLALWLLGGVAPPSVP
jgi:DnaJ-class molecular chaperone